MRTTLEETTDAQTRLVAILVQNPSLNRNRSRSLCPASQHPSRTVEQAMAGAMVESMEVETAGATVVGSTAEGTAEETAEETAEGTAEETAEGTAEETAEEMAGEEIPKGADLESIYIRPRNCSIHILLAAACPNHFLWSLNSHCLPLTNDRKLFHLVQHAHLLQYRRLIPVNSLRDHLVPALTEPN